jgi:AmiR/NasT family two-component response regulator
MSAADNAAGWRAALNSRDRIGQAKEILVERYKVTHEAAFAMLIGASQRRNVKIRDIAEQLTTTGEFSP